MPAVTGRESKAEKEIRRGLVRPSFLSFRNNPDRLGNPAHEKVRSWYPSYCRQTGWGKEGIVMAKERSEKERFIEVYSQGLTNVEKIIVDTQTGVNYLLAASTLTTGCGMSILVDADGKPIVTPID